jgi:hypothetical protein
MTTTQAGYFWLALTAGLGVVVPCYLALVAVRFVRWVFSR